MSLNHLVSQNPDTPELDSSVKNLTVQGSVNNLTPFGGLFMITSSGLLISNTTEEINLIQGATLKGSNQVPANAFEISSFHANYSGSFNSLNNRTLALRVRSNGSLLAEFPAIQLTGAQNESFETELDFSIRSLGGPGVASISTNVDFTYGDQGATSWRGERACVVNDTTFDTTVDNELVITAQFSDADEDLNIQCLQAFVTRVF
jgi:hypothetical protein